MLQAEGYEVLGARHGQEALRHLDQVGGAVDLVIVDVVMPVMGAGELTEELARRYPDISVVWMSGHPREVEMRSADPLKDLPFLQKPIPPRVLSDTIDQVLRQRREKNRS
jgi:two-component system cell cycle sensor histidine kinase/response regulator CckA